MLFEQFYWVFSETVRKRAARFKICCGKYSRLGFAHIFLVRCAFVVRLLAPSSIYQSDKSDSGQFCAGRSGLDFAFLSLAKHVVGFASFTYSTVPAGHALSWRRETVR